MTGNLFGSCDDLHVTWETGLFNEAGQKIVRFTSADGTATLDFCLENLKGAVVIDAEGNETPVEVVDGVLQLSDMFGSGAISEDGETYTITFPGQEPQALCVNPQKGTVDAQGNDLVNEDGVAELPPYVESINGQGPDETGDIAVPIRAPAIKKDGLEYEGPYTPLNVDSLQNLDRPASAGLGDLLIGQTASGDCVQFSPSDEVGVATINGEMPDENGDIQLDIPTQTGEAQISTVDADGNTTYVDADGVEQTVPAIDVNGDPVDPSQAVWNFVDAEGNYLGSKPCKDETVLSENTDGVVYPINQETGNQVIPEAPELRNCLEEVIDPTDPDTHFHTADQGSLFLPLGRGASGTNANVFNPECVPPEPPCPDHPVISSHSGIVWQWDVAQQRQRAIAATSCFRTHEEDGAVGTFPANSSYAGDVVNIDPVNGGLTDAELVAAHAANGNGQAIPFAIHETCIPAGKCMQRIIYGGHYRSNPTSELSSQINLNVLTEVSDDGGTTWANSALWGGATGKTLGLRSCLLAAIATIDADCDFVIMNDDYNLDQHSPGFRLINPGDPDFCIRTILTYTFAEDYVSRPDNRLTPGSQQLTFMSQRNTETICTAQVFDGYQF